MKKYLSSFLVVVLGGCMVFPPSVDEKARLKEDPVITNKVSLYCPRCSKSEVEEYFVFADSEKDADYKLTLEVEDYADYSDEWDILGPLFTVLSAGIIPTYLGSCEYTLNAELLNSKNDYKMALTKAELSGSFWYPGLLLLPLAPFAYFQDEYNACGDYDLRMSAREEVEDVFIKEAALAVYGSKKSEWSCGTFDCTYKEMLAKKSVSFDDLKTTIKSVKNMEQFKKVYARFNGNLTKSQTCELAGNAIFYGNLKKTNQAYWDFIQYFKSAKCPVMKTEEDNIEGLGMSVEKLIEKNGKPARFKIENSDTQVATWAKLGSGYLKKYVYYDVYTIDDGIVVKIESKR